MTKIKIAGVLSVILLVGCSEQNNIYTDIFDIKSDLNDSTIVYPQLYEIEERYAPAQFSLQSNSEALIVAPRLPASDYSLFYYPHQKMDTCCPQMNGLMKSGKGPGESGAIISGTRTADGDTLIYYSMDTSRFYYFDKNLTLIKDPLVNKRDILVTDRFTYTNNRYYSEATFSEDEKILRVYNSHSGTTRNLIDYRVPHGYQPAARNNIASIVSTPEHILVALVGEKEILILNDKDRVIGKIILGENDPIPEPYKPTSPEDVKSSLQHIYKMEYLDGMIFILMKSGLIVLNNEFEFVTKFIFNNINNKNLDISDFTINNDMLYLRKDLSSLYRIDYSDIKFELTKKQV